MSSLFLPLVSRDAYIAVRAFHLELGSLRSASRGNAQAVAVRIAFWNDQIRIVLRESGVSEHPIGVALGEASRNFQMTPRWFERTLEARLDTSDESKPLVPSCLADAEDYSESLWSSALYSELECVGMPDDCPSFDAASCIGRSQGLVALIRSIALESSAGRSIFVPRDGYDMLSSSVEGSEKLDGRSDLESKRGELHDLVETLTVRSDELLSQAQTSLDSISDRKRRRRAVGVMLPVLSARRFTRALRECGFEPQDPSLLLVPSTLSIQWDMLRAYATVRLV